MRAIVAILFSSFVSSGLFANANLTYSVSTFANNKIRVSSHVDLSRSCEEAWEHFVDLARWREWNDSLTADDVESRLPIQVDDILHVFGKHSLWWSPQKIFRVKIRIIKLEENRK